VTYATNRRLFSVASGDRRFVASGLGYAMADYAVWTVAEIDDEIARFTNEVTATQGDVDTHRNALIAAGDAGTRFWNEWQVFFRDWSNYRSAHPRSTGVSRAMLAQPNELRALIDRYNALEPRFRALTGVTSTPRSGDTRARSVTQWFSDNTPAVAGGGALVALGLGAVALVAVAVIATQARVALAPLRAVRRNRRRRKSR
jgi:hypothetical protein